ncbi:MAG TPA: papain-like cysteine protease family protein [Chthoniobacterales bacterium]|jgi:hypothetical protein|nr:papain-like cysteine protease family protein [Chthoniobacterales bacterium]
MKILNVPHIQQPTGSNLCWAACALMVYKYYNRGSAEALSNVVNYFGGMTQAGCSAMSMLYLQGKNLKPSKIFKDLDMDFIVGCLDRGSPYLISYQLNSGTSHMVVVGGYDTSAQGAVTFYVEDPAEPNSQLPYALNELAKLRGEAREVIDGFAV